MKWTTPYWIQQPRFVSSCIVNPPRHMASHVTFFDVSWIGDAKSHAQLLANETPSQRRGELRPKSGEICGSFSLEDSGLNLVRWKRVDLGVKKFSESKSWSQINALEWTQGVRILGHSPWQCHTSIRHRLIHLDKNLQRSCYRQGLLGHLWIWDTMSCHSRSQVMTSFLWDVFCWWENNSWKQKGYQEIWRVWVNVCAQNVRIMSSSSESLIDLSFFECKVIVPLWKHTFHHSNVQVFQFSIETSRQTRRVSDIHFLPCIHLFKFDVWVFWHRPPWLFGQRQTWHPSTACMDSPVPWLRHRILQESHLV